MSILGIESRSGNDNAEDDDGCGYTGPARDSARDSAATDAGPARDSTANAGLDAAKLAQKLGEEAKEAARAAIAAASVALRIASTPSSPMAAPTAAPAPAGTGPAFKQGWHLDQWRQPVNVPPRLAALDLAIRDRFSPSSARQPRACPRSLSGLASSDVRYSSPLTADAGTDAVALPRTARLSADRSDSETCCARDGRDNVGPEVDATKQLDVADQQDTGDGSSS